MQPEMEELCLLAVPYCLVGGANTLLDLLVLNVLL